MVRLKASEEALSLGEEQSKESVEEAYNEESLEEVLKKQQEANEEEKDGSSHTTVKHYKGLSCVLLAGGEGLGSAVRGTGRVVGKAASSIMDFVSKSDNGAVEKQALPIASKTPDITSNRSTAKEEIDKGNALIVDGNSNRSEKSEKVFESINEAFQSGSDDKMKTAMAGLSTLGADDRLDFINSQNSAMKHLQNATGKVEDNSLMNARFGQKMEDAFGSDLGKDARSKEIAA